MGIPTFVQKTRINQVIYQIRGGRLCISARGLLGRFQDHEIKLQWIDPNYTPGLTRRYTPLVLSLLLSVLCGLIVWGGLVQTAIPREAVLNIIQWPAIGFAVFFASAIQWSRRIEYYSFKNRAGHPALVIIREKHQADECAAFINLLVSHIEIAQADLSPEAKAELLKKKTAEHAFVPPGIRRLELWKVSVGLGFLSAGLPWIPHLDEYLWGFLFPIVFSCCVGGVALCAFSFSNNEPGRWWSVIGLVLSLVPPAFYL